MKCKPIVTGSLTVALLGVVPPTFAAGRACVDNFAQSNQTSQKFQSFVEITSDSNKALIALGRAFAADGFLGVSANKDLGIVSGYFETNLKKSTVNGTVTEAPAGKVKVELAIQLNQDLRASNAAMPWRE